MLRVRTHARRVCSARSQVSGLADMGFYPGITPLMVAAISEQSGPVTLGCSSREGVCCGTNS